MNHHTTPTLPDIITYTLECSTDSDLNRIVDAIRQRRMILRKKAAAALTEGSRIETGNLKPKYLNNLTGHIKTIESIRGVHCAVITLDHESTAALAAASAKYVSLSELDTFDLSGIPLTACRAITSDEQPDSQPSTATRTNNPSLTKENLS